jgi:hypothetical protein
MNRHLAWHLGRLTALALGLALVLAPPARAAYPERPITMVVPFSAGGTTDILARIVGEELGRRLGQQVVIDNRTGAGGNIGTAVVAKAAPDGYTLVGGPASLFTILPAQKEKLPIDVNKDFAHIGMIVGSSVRTGRPAPNGGTVTVTSLNFAAGVDVSLITALPASAKVRLTLPAGLTWGNDLPDPTESCTSTPSTGECQTPPLEPITGRNSVGWGWDVVAARTGSYALQAEIVSASEPDPEPSNNRASVTVVVAGHRPPPPPGVGARASGPSSPGEAEAISRRRLVG